MLKLRFASFDRFAFPVGAFAEDGSERSELVARALDQIQRLIGENPDPKRVLIVGDTLHDIATARQSGCRVPAVATGAYSLDQLKSENPDMAVQDLLDPRPPYEMMSITQVH